jgi:hypothetical protein
MLGSISQRVKIYARGIELILTCLVTSLSRIDFVSRIHSNLKLELELLIQEFIFTLKIIFSHNQVHKINSLKINFSHLVTKQASNLP